MQHEIRHRDEAIQPEIPTGQAPTVVHQVTSPDLQLSIETTEPSPPLNTETLYRDLLTSLDLKQKRSLNPERNLFVVDSATSIVYKTYLLERPDNLAQWAVDLLHARVARFVYHSIGHAFWHDETEVRHETLNPNQQPYVVPNETHVRLPQDLTPAAATSALAAAEMAFYEHHSLSSVALEHYTYIRLFLPEVLVGTQRDEITLYPCVTIYENGAVLIEYTTYFLNNFYTTHQFVADTINAPQQHVRDIHYPVEIFRRDARQYLLNEDEGIRARFRNLMTLRYVDGLVEKHAVDKQMEGEAGAYSTRLISNNPLSAESELRENLYVITEAVLHALLDVVNRERLDWRYVVTGRRRCRYHRGRLWSSRPTAAIFKYKAQEAAASQIRGNRAQDIGRILNRATSDLKVPAADLRDYRFFNDYALFVDRALTLYVYAAKPLPQGYDSEMRRLVAQAHFTDYLVASYHRLNELAVDHARSVADLIDLRRQQLDLDDVVRHAANNGELLDLYAQLLNVQGTSELKGALLSSSSLMIEKFKESQNLRRQRFQWGIAVLFGVIAAATNGGALITTLVEPTGWNPSPVMAAELAVGAVLLALLVLNWVFLRKP